VPERRDLLLLEGGAGGDRTMESAVQHGAAAFVAGLPATGAEGKPAQARGAWRCGKRSAFPTSPHPRRRLRTNFKRGATLTIYLVQKIGQVNISGSMSDKIDKSREAVVEFFRTANPQDEFFLITFSEKPEVLVDFTSSVEDIQSKLVYTVPKGRTALLDAIYLGMNRMRKAHYERKALLIISDGGDNHSRYTEGEIKSMVREADVQIYGIGLFDVNGFK